MHLNVAVRSVSRSLASARSVARVGAAAAVRHTSTMHENDPEVLEREKKRNLSGRQHTNPALHAHAPGWNETLASASEAAVKSDQGNVPVDRLQEETVEYLRSRSDDAPPSANYMKDEVTGPLSGKGADNDHARVVKETYIERERVEYLPDDHNPQPTRSEQYVKADHGVYDVIGKWETER